MFEQVRETVARRWWLLPVVGLVVGAAVGAVVGLTGRDGDALPPSQGSATTAPADAATTAATSAAPTSVVSQAGLVVESGFSTRVDAVDNRFTSVGATVSNPTNQLVCGASVQFTLVDGGGAQIETVTERIEFIPAGATAFVAPVQLGFNAPAEPARLDVAVIAVDAAAGGSTFADCDSPAEIQGVVMDVSGVVLERGQVTAEISGEVSNPGGDVVEEAAVDCIYRAGGAIVGGQAGGIVDPVEPGDADEFVVPTAFAPDSDSVECQILG